LYDLYNDFSSEMPEALALLNYPSELNWFLKEKLAMQDEDIYFTQN
jgi:hypothetical protein